MIQKSLSTVFSPSPNSVAHLLYSPDVSISSSLGLIQVLIMPCHPSAATIVWPTVTHETISNLQTSSSLTIPTSHSKALAWTSPILWKFCITFIKKQSLFSGKIYFSVCPMSSLELTAQPFLWIIFAILLLDMESSPANETLTGRS